jgi:riboflavin transporter
MTRKDGTLSPTRRLATIAILGALGGILMIFEFPLPFAPAFMGVDFSDTPIMLASMTMGPIAGVATSAVKIFIKLLIKPTSTQYIGELSNLFLSMVIAITVGLIYQRFHNKKGMKIGVMATIVTMSTAALFSNAYVIYPLYAKLLNFPAELIIDMTTKINFLVHDYFTLMIFMVVPFNLVKQSLVAILSLFLFERIHPILEG